MSDPLFFPSLLVSGFRAFKELRIEKLGRVNLIVGKNNVGKSSLLEALWLYLNSGNIREIFRILESRNEILRSRLLSAKARTELSDEIYRSQLTGIQSLFYGREDLNSHAQMIHIGTLENKQTSLAIRFKETPDQKRFFENLPDLENFPVLGVQVGIKERTYKLDRPIQYNALSTQRDPKNKSIFVSADGFSESELNTIWDKIALTSAEEEVLSALQIIEPRLEKVNLLGSEGNIYRRIPVVKLRGWTEPVPLRSLGDGMQRLLGIALAAVSAQGHVLLIDEIENGLHYSVQSDVWRLLYKIANKLNVQVFATTHSWDCIRAFQKASQASEGDGMLIRLENKRGEIVPTLFDERELSIVTREQIEVR